MFRVLKPHHGEAPYGELSDSELEDRVYLFAIFLPCGKAGGLQILRCQGLAVVLLRRHPWRLDSEALRLLQR
jgi:hypothetical protein